jgi:hypothetical protein
MRRAEYYFSLIMHACWSLDPWLYGMPFRQLSHPRTSLFIIHGKECRGNVKSARKTTLPGVNYDLKQVVEIDK